MKVRKIPFSLAYKPKYSLGAKSNLIYAMGKQFHWIHMVLKQKNNGEKCSKFILVI